jgi:protein tyrosine phosphatase type 4A
VVRLCGNTYNPSPIINSDIKFYDLDYPDGSTPNKELLFVWNELIKLNEPILVHCFAGLGRSPVLVTISLIENNMKYSDAIEYIREKKHGALNSKQLEWLREYKRTPSKTKFLKKIFG